MNKFIGASIFLFILFFVLSFFIPTFIDIADFIDAKLFHTERPYQPFMEEMYQRLYEYPSCGQSNLIPVVKNHIPAGMSKKDVITMMARNGFRSQYSSQSGSSSSIVWYGDGTRFILRRYPAIRVFFDRDKVTHTAVQERCFAGL